MAQDVSSVISLVLVFTQHALKQVYAFCTHIVPVWTAIVRLSVHYVVSNFVHVRTNKGNCAADERVKDDAEAPNICLVVISLILDHLW